MSDFVSEFWSVYIAAITVISIVGCGIFLKKFSIKRVAEQVETTGHVWDQDLAEYDHPLPRWWVWLFYITIVFSLIYLALFPGLGSYPGWLQWSSKGKYDAEVAEANARFGPLYDKFLKQDLQAVAADPEARQTGQRLFLTYCAQCHGSDGGGAKGFPSLRDNDWLWGGDPETIKTTIRGGRSGVMPPYGGQPDAVGGAAGAKELAHYVLSLSDSPHDGALAAKGKGKFLTVCVACHTPAGTGMVALGAPNLTDKVWLYGGSEKALIETIVKGRNGVMPAHKELLSDAKIHLLAAYVLGLPKEN